MRPAQGVVEQEPSQNCLSLKKNLRASRAFTLYLLALLARSARFLDALESARSAQEVPKDTEGNRAKRVSVS